MQAFWFYMLNYGRRIFPVHWLLYSSWYMLLSCSIIASFFATKLYMHASKKTFWLYMHVCVPTMQISIYIVGYIFSSLYGRYPTIIALTTTFEQCLSVGLFVLHSERGAWRWPLMCMPLIIVHHGVSYPSESSQGQYTLTQFNHCYLHYWCVRYCVFGVGWND